MFSENTRVLKARSGSPEKKSVSPRYIDYQYRGRGPSRATCNVCYEHFRDIATSRRRPRARYRLEQVRRGPRGTVLSNIASAHVITGQERMEDLREIIPPQHDEQLLPMAGIGYFARLRMAMYFEGSTL